MKRVKTIKEKMDDIFKNVPETKVLKEDFNLLISTEQYVEYLKVIGSTLLDRNNFLERKVKRLEKKLKNK